MRNVIRAGATAAAILMLAGVALAQSDWYEHRTERYHGEQWRARMFAQIKEDLNHVQSQTFPVSRDEYRLVQTKRQLDDLQNDLNEHRYDQPTLDQVIARLQKVAADNRMSPRDRDILNDDVQRLQNYRAHHDHWSQ